MPIKWLRPEQIKDLNRKALYEGEPHGLNPGSDLEGALNRPRGHHYYEDTESFYELAALYAIALTRSGTETSERRS